MAQSLALMDSLGEGLSRGVRKAQDDAHDSARHAGAYDTFELEEGDRRGGGGHREDNEVTRTNGCSPWVLLRFLASAVRGGEQSEESWLLTERQRTAPSAGRSSQLTRYLPGVMKEVAHRVKGAGKWIAEGLREYVDSGGYYFMHDATPSVTHMSSWDSRYCY